MKTASDYMKEADAIVPRITSEEGIAKHNAGGSVFIDVRDSGEIAKSGTIEGAVRMTRGMVEFQADSTHPAFIGGLNKDDDIVLICGAGGQAALAGKTMMEMGYSKVSNVGGLNSWKEAGGPTEAG